MTEIDPTSYLYSNEIEEEYIFCWLRCADVHRMIVLAKNPVHATRLFYEANPSIKTFMITCP